MISWISLRTDPDVPGTVVPRVGERLPDELQGTDAILGELAYQIDPIEFPLDGHGVERGSNRSIQYWAQLWSVDRGGAMGPSEGPELNSFWRGRSPLVLGPRVDGERVAGRAALRACRTAASTSGA